MRQGSFRNVTRRNKEHANNKDISYKTQIVGGVIRKIPIQVSYTRIVSNYRSVDIITVNSISYRYAHLIMLTLPCM